MTLHTNNNNNTNATTNTTTTNTPIHDQDVQHMISLLNGLIQPNTEIIRPAEQALKPILKHPTSMEVLWVIIQSTTPPPPPMIDPSIVQQQQQQLNIIITSEQQYIAIRHVATIVLRKRLPTHYSNITDSNIRITWQTKILQALAMEQIRPIQTGLLGVAAAIAAQDPTSTTTDHNNNPYLSFMMAASSSNNTTTTTTNNNNSINAQTLLFQLLEEMTSTIGNYWKERVHDLYQLYYNVLSVRMTTENSSSNNMSVVQCAAVKALGQLLSFWVDDETEMNIMAPLLPLFLQVAADHITLSSATAATAAAAGTTATSNNTTTTTTTNPIDDDLVDDLLSTVLDVLYDLSYSTANALTQYMTMIIEFALLCLQSKHLSLRVRDAAALVIATTAEAKSKLFGRQTQLVGKVVDTLFQLMKDSPASAAGALFESNPAWREDLENAIDAADHHNDDDDDDNDPDSPTETSMAQGTLDVLACELNNKFIWPICITRCMTLMNNEHDASARKAGIAGLGVIAEGCYEKCMEQLHDIMPYVFRACTDPISAQVRECACFCLGQLSEHCQPDILNYSTQILPIIFGLLDDGSVAVQATSCYVLEMFCERLEPSAVRPVLDQLVRKLAIMLESTTTKRSVQEMAVAAIAATAVAAEQDFIPYVPVIASFMEQRMAITNESHFSLRGRALECMGHIAIAVGKDHFRPYFPITMQRAMEGLQMNSTDLQEFAYAVFANLSTVMGEEFAPALPELVPYLIQVIDQDEGQFERRSDNEDKDGFTALDDSDDEDNDEEGGNPGDFVLHVRTALLESKKGAITALGEMAGHTGTAFCPYIEGSMQVLQKCASNWHALIKTEAADAMPSLIVPSIAAYHDGKCEWKKGDITGIHNFQLSQHTAAIAHAVLVEEIALLKDDESKTVAKACESIQSVIELCGPMVVMPILNDLLSATHELVIKVAPCQNQDEGLYEGDVDDDDEHDTTTQAACDLVGALMRVLGAQLFGQYLVPFFPPLVDYCKSSRPPADRGMAMGCLGEIAQECIGDEYGMAVVQNNWSTVFFPCIISTITDSENDNVQRNAAFCAGVCIETLRDRIPIPDCQTILQHLGPLLYRPKNQDNSIPISDSIMACVDNAVSAVARMIMYSPTNAIPLSQVLPVFLAALPLESDYTENDTVYNCLIGLMQMAKTNNDVQMHAANIQRLLSEACQNEEEGVLEDDTRNKIKEALQSLNSQ